MCQIIVENQDHIAEQDAIEGSYVANSDGIGEIIVFRDLSPVVRRFLDYDEYLDKRMSSIDHLFKTGTPYTRITHFRLASHGDVNISNVHPFFIYEHDAYLVHNGIVRNVQPPGSNRSDTYHLARFLGTLPSLDGVDKWLEKTEPSSRFVLVQKNNVKIINERTGYWQNGIWYANRSHETMGYWKDDLFDDDIKDWEQKDEEKDDPFFYDETPLNKKSTGWRKKGSSWWLR